MSSPPPSSSPSGRKEPTWKLPDGIEDHIESGIIKAVAGATVGGLVGCILFKSGSGWRSASVAAGVGTAVGSTIERAMVKKE